MFARRCAVVAALFLAIPVVAEDPTAEEVNAKGKPTTYKPGLTPRYAIWYDDAGWHFHNTTNTATQTEFSGRIDVVGGKITIDLKGGLGGPAANTPPAKKPDPKKGGLGMESKGYNFSDKVNKGVQSGIVFHPDADVTALTFDLKINGKPAEPGQIFIGAKGEHPKESKFTLAVPMRKDKK